ncbi:MAG: O-antigen ligase family protein [Candidatus Omnitrophica bacterium]|nr:O-antigen ligase family protein [Candidatus Omnitrophota bacterium]
MSDQSFKNIIFRGLSGVIIFSALAMGAVELWSITIVEWVVLMLLLLWFWRMNNQGKMGTQKKKVSLDFSLPDFSIRLFVCLAIASWFFSIYRFDSMLSFFRLMTYVAVYYLVVNHFNWRVRVRFFALIVALGAALSLLGIGQYFFGLNHGWWNSPRLLSATYVNHAHFAGLLEMAIPLNFGLLIGLNRDEVSGPFQLVKWRVLLSLALGAMITAFILTQSRGAWIVLAVASVILCITLVKQRSLPKWGMAVLLLGLALFIGFLGFAEDGVAGRLHTINMGEESTFLQARLTVWEYSAGIIKDHPWTGTGIGTFAWAFPKYRPEGFGVRFYYTHNDYIQTIVEMGVLVIPILVWGIFVILKRGFGRGRDEFLLKRATRLACGVGILSLMLHGLVDFNFHIPANMIIFVCLVAIVSRRENGSRDSSPSPRSGSE